MSERRVRLLRPLGLWLLCCLVLHLAVGAILAGTLLDAVKLGTDADIFSPGGERLLELLRIYRSQLGSAALLSLALFLAAQLSILFAHQQVWRVSNALAAGNLQGPERRLLVTLPLYLLSRAVLLLLRLVAAYAAGKLLLRSYHSLDGGIAPRVGLTALGVLLVLSGVYLIFCVFIDGWTAAVFQRRPTPDASVWRSVQHAHQALSRRWLRLSLVRGLFATFALVHAIFMLAWSAPSELAARRGASVLLDVLGTLAFVAMPLLADTAWYSYLGKRLARD